jgi:HPr kinase/phosphorylase
LTVTVRQLLDAAGQVLKLRLVAGARGVDRTIGAPRVQLPGLALAGFLPQLHPDRVQVLGNSEVSYLGTLGEDAARTAVRAVADGGVACFVVTNGTPAPAALLEAAEATGVATFETSLRTADFIDVATTWLEDRLAPEVLLHGDLVEMYGLGVLILGKSGIGKSEAALDLVSRGHRLVADDVVQLRRISPTMLRGQAARLLEHHMEIRGVGVIDVEALFGTLATVDEGEVDLIVELVEWPGAPDRLGLIEEQRAVLDVELPVVKLPVRPGRSIALLIETAARNHLLRRRGLNSAGALSERLDRELEGRRETRTRSSGR